MISHPFEVKASVLDARPEVLMITWRGAPAQTNAEIYLPAVSSADILALADTLYGRHRLTATDANTIQFPGSDLTLIPLPAGVGAYAGLLSVDARPAVPVGLDFSVAVRQLNPVTVSLPRQRDVDVIAAAEQDAVSEDTVEGWTDNDSGRHSIDKTATSSSWRRVRGAFQFTFTGKSQPVLVDEQVRLLSWLKWRVGVTPAGNRWNLVLQRYLKYTENVVWGLGTDPNSVPPSDIGDVVGNGGHGGAGGHGGEGGHGGHGPHGGSDGGGWMTPHHDQEATGKVSAVHYDRFGDFRGFTILTEHGHERDYVSTEHLIEELVRTAWVERSVVRVMSEEDHPERPDRLILLRSH